MLVFLVNTATNSNDIMNNAVLTAAVFAAIITSVTNLIITIINGERLKIIEKRKQQDEIIKYRYSRLYEVILNWHNYDSEYSGDSPEKIAANRLTNLFLDDTGRYEIVKPLLDDPYKMYLDALLQRGNEELNKLVSQPESMDTHSDMDAYFQISCEFSKELKKAINAQLEKLIVQNK